MSMSRKTVELNIPRTAAERIAAQDAWKCCGCGKPYPDREGQCDCSTGVLFQETVRGIAHETKRVNDMLTHDDLCRLSRAFNRTANLADPQDFRINEALKRGIAAAALKARESQP